MVLTKEQTIEHLKRGGIVSQVGDCDLVEISAALVKSGERCGDYTATETDTGWAIHKTRKQGAKQ